MCGRFARTVPAEKIAEVFGAKAAEAVPASWNCAPGRDVAIILPEGSSFSVQKAFWGMMPVWGKGRLRQPFINIRSETLLEKRTFEQLLRQGCCLIPADGFYEWKTEERGKQPYFVRLPGGPLFFMAGLQDSEDAKKGCAVITVRSGARISSLHCRMPLIMDRDEGKAWLDGDTRSLLNKAQEPAGLEIWPVSSFVNNPRNDSPLCAAPLRKDP